MESLSSGTLAAIIGLILTALAGYAALRDLIDKKHEITMKKLDSQTATLSNSGTAADLRIEKKIDDVGHKLDSHGDTITEVCKSLARLEENHKDHERRLTKIEAKI